VPPKRIELDLRPGVVGAGRYVICPASEHLHEEALACEVYPSSNKQVPTAQCDCETRIWVSRRASIDQLLKFEDLAGSFDLVQRRPKLEPLVAENKDEARYVICPHSGRMHPTVHALLVKETVAKQRNGKTRPCFYAYCASCSSRSFLGPRWKRGFGFSLEMAIARNMSVAG